VGWTGVVVGIDFVGTFVRDGSGVMDGFTLGITLGMMLGVTFIDGRMLMGALEITDEILVDIGSLVGMD
jgi:hypothetical protein